MDPALQHKVKRLEALLLDYVERYGLTPNARSYFIGAAPAKAVNDDTAPGAERGFTAMPADG